MSASIGALNGLSTAELQANLTAAQRALHELTIGAKVTTAEFAMGDGSRKVTYSQATIAGLRGYIAELQSALGIGGRRAISIGFR